MLNISPIKLLRGCHPDTGRTGHGCVMNVISYLNGDAVITDRPDNVCPAIRHLATMLNDMSSDEQRQRLIPYIERMMGTNGGATHEFTTRVAQVGYFARYIPGGVWQHVREDVFDRGLRLLHGLCPKVPHALTPEEQARAQQLAMTARKMAIWWSEPKQIKAVKPQPYYIANSKHYSYM